jgi:hypothetical protein
MAAGDVHHPPSPAPSPNPASHLPRLIEFLPREPADTADDTADAIEQSVALKASEVMRCQPVLRAVRKRHGTIVSAVPAERGRIG